MWSINQVARLSLTIHAPIGEVWNALRDPEMIRQYMFGTIVRSGWRSGDIITWEGEWQGKPYKDHGKIIVSEDCHRLVYTHFSPLSGKPDLPENYHTITFELDGDGKRTIVTLSQDNNRNEQDREHAEKNWMMVLEKLKSILETLG